MDIYTWTYTHGHIRIYIYTLDIYTICTYMYIYTKRTWAGCRSMARKHPRPAAQPARLPPLRCVSS